MEQEIKKLVKLGKKRLVEICTTTLGIEATMDDKAGVMAQWIADEMDDLNTMLEASANVKKDSVVKKSDNKGIFAGYHPITKEKIYN